MSKLKWQTPGKRCAEREHEAAVHKETQETSASLQLHSRRDRDSRGELGELAHPHPAKGAERRVKAISALTRTPTDSIMPM